MARILSKEKARMGTEVWQGTGIGTDAERRLSSFNAMDADHEGSRGTETRPGLSRQSVFPTTGLDGMGSQARRGQGPEAGRPTESREHLGTEDTPPDICYTLIPQGDHGSPHETKVQLNKYSMRT